MNRTLVWVCCLAAIGILFTMAIIALAPYIAAAVVLLIFCRSAILCSPDKDEPENKTVNVALLKQVEELKENKPEFWLHPRT